MASQSEPPFALSDGKSQVDARSDNVEPDRSLDAQLVLLRAASGSSVESAAAIIDTRSAKTPESGEPSGHYAVREVSGPESHVAVNAEGPPSRPPGAVQTGDVHDRDGKFDVSVGLLRRSPIVLKPFAHDGYRIPRLGAAPKAPCVSEFIEIVEKPERAGELTVPCRG